jgi:hypothetical protein
MSFVSVSKDRIASEGVQFSIVHSFQMYTNLLSGSGSDPD